MMKKFKKGVASFYIVAFSTLILVIIAASFAAIIISEMARTSNDDLAQSAYDSALAGVEDAKLAFYNYQNCLAQGKSKATSINNDGILTCEEIIYIIEDGNDDCDMVAKILGREVTEVDAAGNKGVVISESSVNNNMLQSYTCVEIQNVLSDYRATLTSSNPSRIVRVKLDDGRSATEIKTVEISWFADNSNTRLTYNNFNKSVTPNRVVFKPLALGAAVPPTISVTMIQTGGSSFTLSDFEMTRGNQTNRATVFLVPTDNASSAQKVDNNQNYIGVYRLMPGGGVMGNYVEKEKLLKSNDKTTTNVPYVVYCDPDDGNAYLCSATLELPEAVGGGRNDDTFLFVVSLPYGKPASTDFAMKFCDNSDNSGGCTTQTVTAEGETEVVSHTVNLKGVQVGIDSTGRANDLFRRVETRLEASDTNFPYPLYAIQLLGDGNKDLLKKNEPVLCEWNFPNRGC